MELHLNNYSGIHVQGCVMISGLVCDSPEGLISNSARSSALALIMFISLAELCKEAVS